MKRTFIALAMALMVSVAFGQEKAFKQLAKIEGVEHVHIGKFLLSLAAKNEGVSLDLGDGNISIGNSDNLLKKIDDINIYTSEEKDAATQLSKRVRNVLGTDGWEPLVDMKDEDGEKVKIYQRPQGKHTTVAIFAEEEGEATLVLIKGALDIAKLLEEENEESEDSKLSLSVKQTVWEEDDDEKEPRKFRDCLIVIDGKVYPNLHTQTEAAKYIYEHNMEWNGIPKVLEGKDVKKKYPDTKKKVAFEYTTTNNNPNI
jgi:hypothetical protein